MEDRTGWTENKLVALKGLEIERNNNILWWSYYELLVSLAPAPARVCGRDGEVRHVGVVKQMVHPLSDWLSSELGEEEKNSLFSQE